MWKPKNEGQMAGRHRATHTLVISLTWLGYFSKTLAHSDMQI